ncbi:sensor histidine kinase [Arthrobacter sp. RIT-PI-e]|uniref:sensor histidine kinase n=1 Tax=Arthrobacter sp. RIT-PI-e TaxID=1681197 RepID=UPI00128F68E9|nr:PAS domain-containing sensor histidine kinase [Arthrobacter sp. RIT-PI-e]
MSSKTAAPDPAPPFHGWSAEGLDLSGHADRPRTPHRRSILLSQTSTVITLGLAVLLGLLDRPALHSPTLFVTGLLITVVVLAVCCILPWSRVPGRYVILVPLVNLLAVGMSRASAGEGYVAVGLVAALPVVWIAASNVRMRTAVLLTAVPSFAMVWLSLVLDPYRISFDQVVQPVMLPLMLIALALTISALTRDNRARQEELRVSRAELRESMVAGQQRERLLSTVFDAVPVGLLAVDAEGDDLIMNAPQRSAHAAAAPPGIGDPDETQLLIFGEDRVTPLPVEERPVRRAVSGEDLEALQVWVGTGRSQHAIAVSSRAMHDDAGAYAGTVVSFNDVTELILALQAKDDFLSNVSHEFRTPLTSILGYLDLTIETDLPEQVLRNLQVVRRNVLRLERLVEDLLAINAGTFEVHPVVTDVGRLLQEAAASALPCAERAGLHLRNRAPSCLTAVADPVRLAQAVDNLVSNATKYNRTGGSITLDACLDAEGLTVRVEDTGVGIEEEDLLHVFDRFFRSPSARTSTVPGVGLGLLITKSIVSEHGGSITVTSTPGEGSRFTLQLPQPAD